MDTWSEQNIIERSGHISRVSILLSKIGLDISQRTN